MKKNWWKILCVLLLLYSLLAGLLGAVPRRFILEETIRNLYFHVPMWFTMIALFGYSVYASIRFLSGFDRHFDKQAVETVNVGLFFGILGLTTGSLWARYTWGAWWTDDVKLNGSLVTMLVYLAYTVLRNSIPDEQKRARVSAVYNIFAFVLMLVFIMILPRLFDSLHPGNGGNPAFNQYDMEGGMRPVFYAGVAGWILMGAWITSLRLRLKNLEENETTAPQLDNVAHNP